MNKGFFRFVCCCLLLVLLPASCFADAWVDNWIQQSTVTGPNSFESESRGYVYGGRFSARYNQSVDHPITLEAPSFKMGCGGIDIFLGSVGYLDTERLLEKFESIMTGALATYAFDLALNVLCTSCQKELQSLEAIIDRLNALQVDDCKASKAIVGYLNNKTGQGDSAENSEAITNFLQTSGANDLYNDVTDENKDKSINDTGVSKNDLVSGCPSLLKNVFFTSGSVLRNIMSEKGRSTDQVELMAGLVGDVAIDSSLNMSELPPCDENTPLTIDKLIYGELYSMDSSGSCKQIDSISIDGTSYESLAAWARTNIDSIIVAIINKTALTDAQKQFLNQSSIPLYNLLRNDLLIRGNSELTDDSRETIISNYVKPVCTGYAHSMIRDLLTDIRTTLASVGAVTASQSKDTSDCAAGLQNKATVILESIRDRVNARMAEYSTDYHSAVLEDIALTLKSAEIQKLSSDVNTTLEGDDDGED